MINSLQKDSHISWYCRFQKQNSTDANCGKRVNYEPSSSNASDLVSFKGKFNIQKAIENLEKQELKLDPPNKLLVKGGSVIYKVFETARNFVLNEKNIKLEGNEKTSTKLVKNFLGEVIDFHINPNAQVSESVENFMEDEVNSVNIKSIVNYAKKILVKPKEKPKDPEPLTGTDLDNAVKKLVNETIDMIHAIENPPALLKKDWFKSFLGSASDNQAVFSAIAALGFAGVLRPLAIVSLPGQKNNADDKKYAAAHSISSGVIGYGMAVLVSKPIANAIKKIGDNPKKYFKALDKKGKLIATYLGDLGAKSFQGSDEFCTARSSLNMISDMLTSVPKAMLTIAIIPWLLKNLFGLEKKKHKNPEIINSVNNSTINFVNSAYPVKETFQVVKGEKK